MTIVPGKEPVELVMATLRAMKRIRHDGPVDVWLLDEGDDADVRRRRAQIGVKHFSRKGHPEWNRPEGQFRAKTKHGNHNAWRSAHEAARPSSPTSSTASCSVAATVTAPPC